MCISKQFITAWVQRGLFVIDLAKTHMNDYASDEVKAAALVNFTENTCFIKFFFFFFCDLFRVCLFEQSIKIELIS